MSTALVTLTAKLAKRLDLGDGSSLVETLKATAFRQRGNEVVTDAQMEALLIVAEQYRLNPFTKELFAFSDKGAIVPVVSVDGWSRIINEHSQFDGLEFRYSEDIVTPARGKPCPEWCEVTLYRKDRSRPTVVREYLDEVYQAPRGQNGGYDGPWQTHTKRFLRHKTLIQGARIAFGFAGIYDEDEARRIIDAGLIDAATGEVVQPQKQPVVNALPALPAEKFRKQMPAWSKPIKDGTHSVDDLLAFLDAKYTLSDEQRAEVEKLRQRPDQPAAEEAEGAAA
ncbi:MAG: recombinase RecT [Hydrogenophaga sp.]|uniref:recombinase RecT n=1 Tax=Hydrogenophaga sp. TaxID=1904254 RepID=UPI001E10E8CF|nr:recombinase RecT [Hydrogenophaga sp.]MBX3610364.1 recombinase RecT [Hydrogenophaga sp.]